MTDWNAERLDDLMDRYLFGLLDKVTAGRVRRRIETDPEWQMAYEAAVARKRGLIETVRQGAAEAAATRGPEADEVIAAAKQRESRTRRRHRIVRGAFGGIAAAAMIVVTAGWLRVAFLAEPEMSVRLVGQTELLAGSRASLRAIVSDMKGRPLEGKRVELILTSDGPNQRALPLGRWTTGAGGSAVATVQIPDWPEGDYTLIARPGGKENLQLSTPITITRAHKVYLATDKPIYKPGQTIHMRTLILHEPSRKPLARGDAEFSVTDPGGNVIFTEPVTLSDYGIASADLPLDELIRPGLYRITVRSGADQSVQTVEVFHYTLPAFAVKITLDKPYYLPGQRVSGHVQADYHFGKPVVDGKVALKLGPGFAMGTRQERTVTTDAKGRAEFAFTLPARLFGSRLAQRGANLQLTARVTDTGGQENASARSVHVAPQDIRIAVVPENGALASGLEGRIYIVTSYPDGRPAETVVAIETLARSVRTDKAGTAVVSVRDVPQRLRLSARDAAGLTGKTEARLHEAHDAFILRTDKAVYTAGQRASVEIVAARDGEVYLDVVKNRQTVLTGAVTLSGGRGTLALDLPPDLAGTLKLHAYRLSGDAEWVGRDRLIIVTPAKQLKVTVTTARPGPYRPGQDATLNFRVTGSGGSTGVPAAISLAAVDSAVYSVHRAAPGLSATLAGLDAELLAPAVEVHGFDLDMLAGHDLYAQAALAAAAMGNPSTGGRDNNSAGPNRDNEDVFDGEKTGLHSLNQDNHRDIRNANRQRKRGTRREARTMSRLFIPAALAALGLLALFWNAQTTAAVGRAVRSRTALALGCTILGMAIVALLIGLLASQRLYMNLGHNKAEEGHDPGDLSHSPDARFESEPTGQAYANDVTMIPTDRPGAKAVDVFGREPDSGSHLPVIPTDDQSAAPPARVRSYFPETMLWRPEIITDEKGRASLTVPLADSITTWRLTGSAVSADGQLGAVDSAVRVFQPFFVDVDAPVALTSGDEVSLPIVVYNYTPGPLEVSLQAEGSAALEILGGAKASLRIAPRLVTSVFVRVRAGSPGRARLTVRASAAGVADAIVREIAIDPPGVPQHRVVNGSVSGPEQFVNVTIPADAAAGSVSVRLKVYPSRFSELLDGLEGIFRMPHGCFEQTSSTTYPNVMALSYMRARRRGGEPLGSPEVRAKATHYIHLGCQRLLSFEVGASGGFSLYGDPPANLPLTAYGLMQFTDMSRVHRVDPAVLARTARWLARQQNANGSWTGRLPMSHGRADRALAVTAYVTWALSGSKSQRAAAQRGASYVAEFLAGATDAHTLALCANALLAMDADAAAARTAADRLARMVADAKGGQKYWSAAGARLAYGRGASADIETTALAALALNRANGHRPIVDGALRYLADHRDGSGTWGTTQATVAALKAMLASARTPAKRDRDATFTVEEVTGDARQRPLGQLTVTRAKSGAVHTLRLDGLTTPGAHRLRLATADAVGMGYQVVLHYHAPTAPAAPGAPLTVKVDYDTSDLQETQIVHVRATVANRSAEEAKVLLVDLGTPPGFSVDPTILDGLVKAGQIDRYTLTARGVIVYVPAIAARSDLVIGYDMRARYPVRAVAAPTRVYAYYQPELSAAAQPPRIETDAGAN